MEPQTMSTQLKHQHPTDQTGSHKKVKASKLSIKLNTLTEGDLHDIDEIVQEVTFEELTNM